MSHQPSIDLVPAIQPFINAPEASPVLRAASGAASLPHAIAPAASRHAKPPVVILGGEANALSVARDLGQLGIAVYAVGESDSSTRYSRYCCWITPPDLGSAEKSWAAFLLGPQSDYLQGAVVLSCSDAGLQVLIRNREALQAKYLLDDSAPDAQLTMLDKLTTYKLARSAGVSVPLFWEVSQREQVVSLRGELVFPLLVKPRLSHIFEAKFGRKHVTIHNYDELMTAFDTASGPGMDLLLMELIPGGDDRLCSYYTYLDERSTALFHFTKRIIRRYPAGMGAACYHITDWVPQIVEPAQKLFRHVGLRGLANVEFKRDDRDGQYKLIECNARFTASNCLVSASGFSLARYVYNRVTGQPLPAMEKYKIGLRLWDPIRDFRAYLELRKTGELSLFRWLAGVMHLHTWQYFRWSDPKPTISRFLKPLRNLFRKT